jgi:hypothetical protein
MDDEKPCGRKAEWIVVGDVLDGGEGFVATCRECYQNGIGKSFPDTADNLVLASAFGGSFGREPMCGDDDDSRELYDAIDAATKGAKDTPLSHRAFAQSRVESEIRARAHRIVIHRRFQRLELSVGMLTRIVAIAVGLYAADASKKWLPWGGWSWTAVFGIVSVLFDRLIRLGRLTKSAKVPPARKHIA